MSAQLATAISDLEEAEVLRNGARTPGLRCVPAVEDSSIDVELTVWSPVSTVACFIDR